MEGKEEKTNPGGNQGDKSLASKCGLWSYLNTFDGTIARMNCKSWRCEDCRKKRANVVRDKFIELGRNYELNRFLTLTIDPKKVGKEDSSSKALRMRYLKVCWHKFCMNMKKNFGAFEFLWVVEWHKEKNPFPHLHVMVSAFLPKKRIQRAWKSAGGGFLKIARAKGVNNLAEYCCKYMSKDVILSVADLAKGTRIWGRSRQLKTVDELVHFLHNSDWILVKHSIEEIEKRKYYGKTQQEREDLEATCRPLLESCIKTSIKDLEAQITAYKHEQGKIIEIAEVANQCRYKEGVR